jgi:iron complex outermembrane recepter protein
MGVQMSKSTTGWRHCLWVAPLTVAIAAPVYAQAPADESAGISEVIVTARKREEALLEVPLAITAVTAEDIQARGIRDVRGVISQDPSMSFDQGIAPDDTRIVVRGLSPSRGRPNVASLVDGVDVSSESIGVAGGSQLINPRLVDIARVEVVKGPQSALYGRSAFAGAINYVTADPGKEVSGSASADYNQHDYVELKAAVSLPLTDTLGIRLNGYGFDDGGYYRNSVNGARVGGGHGQGGSLSLKWQPTDGYSLKFRTEYADDTYRPPAQATLPFNTRITTPAAASSCRIYTTTATAVTGSPTAAGTVLAVPGPVLDPSCATLDVNALIPGVFRNPINRLELSTGSQGYFDDAHIRAVTGAVPSGDSLRVAFNPDYARSTDNGLTAPNFPGSNRQVTRLSAVQDLSVSFGTFSALTGYTRALVSSQTDIDKTATLTVQQRLDTNTTTEQFSQEVRFTSDFNGPLQAVAGLQYWTERADQFDSNITVIGAGIACVLVSPANACPAPAFGGGFTSTSVTPYMDNAAAVRVPQWTRRLTDHKSAYLELEWSISDQLKLIGEARQVDEKNTVVGPFTNSQGVGTVVICGQTGNCANAAAIPYAAAPGAPASFIGAPILRYDTFSRKDKYVTPKGTIQWQPSANLNVYGSYSVGKKPGGYSTIGIGGSGIPSAAEIEFKAETVKVAEIGAKWASPSRRVLLTGAAFRQEFKDKQVGQQQLIGNNLANRITNAGGAEANGLELAGQWKATDNLTLSAGLTHMLKYEFTDYVALTVGAGEIARVGNCTPIVTTVVNPTTRVQTAAVTCQVSRTGNKMEDTPKDAVALNADWRSPIGGNGWVFVAGLDAQYQSKRFLEDDNSAWLDPYWHGNARMGIETDTFSALLYVDNFADNRKITSAGSGPAIADFYFRTGIVTGGPPSLALRSVFAPQIPTTVFANLPNPRTVGLRVNVKF